MNKINPRDISLVVQGPITDKTTQRCLKSARKHFPGSTIILSTWKGSSLAGLDYDVLVENEDPGSNMMGAYNSNCFRQITSTLGGLRVVKTKYVFKIRTDLELKNTNVLKYFTRFNQVNFDPDYKILKNRVVTLTTNNIHRNTKWPFNACDWIFFGLTEDVLNIFDIPMTNDSIKVKDDDGFERDLINPITPEQYIWTRFISKHRPIFLEYVDDASHNNLELTERYFANNCIMLSARRAGIYWLKNPGMMYAQPPALSNSGLYTFTEYKRLLNKYGNNRLIIVPNILESIIYLIVYGLRFKVKKLLIKIGVWPLVFRLMYGKQ